jgi:hypothetical protein
MLVPAPIQRPIALHRNKQPRRVRPLPLRHGVKGVLSQCRISQNWLADRP